MTFDLNRIYNESCTDTMSRMPDGLLHCVVSSPPYWALRDYGVEPNHWPAVSYSPMPGLPPITIPEMKACLGLESTPEAFVGHIVHVYRQVWRVLRDDGTNWVNLGDSYAGNGAAYGDAKSTLSGAKHSTRMGAARKEKKSPSLKPKDMVGIPWRVAFALQADGWYLRQDVIWAKPNPMPESVTDRCTKAHEYIFLLTKSPRYYYDAFAIKEPYQPKTLTTFGCEVKGYGDGSGLIMSENWASHITTRKPKQWKTPDGWDTAPGAHGSIHRNGREKGKPADKQRGHGRRHAGFNDRWDNIPRDEQSAQGANKRSVWTVATKPFPDAHFATFPPELIKPCILAGCPAGGIVYDPFAGSGTTAEVALLYGRQFVGSEISAKYCQINARRLDPIVRQPQITFAQ